LLHVDPLFAPSAHAPGMRGLGINA
jgi:hypothetical protein